MLKKAPHAESKKMLKIAEGCEPFWGSQEGCPGRGGGVNPSRLGGFGAEG